MYKLKHVARRGSSLVAAVGLLGGIGASAIPGIASADALNPLTERSLTLSSSSPGWSYKDGSGNTTYAPPNSGANGQKTGNFFSFRTSSPTTTIKAFTFQYCTTPAGKCYSPGNNGYNDNGTATDASDDTRIADLEGNDSSTGHSDLNVAVSSPAEINSTDWATIQARSSSAGTTSDLYAMTPDHDDSEGNFIVLVNGAPDAGWTMTADNLESSSVTTRNLSDPDAKPTGRDNLITLKKTAGTAINANALVQIKFFGTDGNYITNPGDGAFFVKINNYSDDTDVNPTTSTHIVDGGVTVANVMNESISIQTKVLETMDFSVGVKDPNVYNDSILTARGLPQHGQCNALLMADPEAPGVTDAATYNAQPHNVLKLGDANAEYSLKTSQAYFVDSYWRLSSNSSGGATVYYTGHTLTNTVGDEITPLTDAGSGTVSNPGTEQFGLGLVQDGTASHLVTGDLYGNTTTAGDFAKFVADQADDTKSHLPRLAPLVPTTAYGHAGDATPAFAFSSDADTYTQSIATETTDVVNCVTAKMRYVANIAATTPAGIYTTKINYVASPQY